MLSYEYFNVKLIRIVLIFVFIFFLGYSIFDSYVCYYNYHNYVNYGNNKFVKLFVGIVLLVLKLIINKINGEPENKMDFVSLLKYLVVITSPLLLPPIIQYILKFEGSLGFVLKSLIAGCIQLVVILSVFFAMVPTLFQCNFLYFMGGSNLILELSNNLKNIGNNNMIKARSWNISVVDNTVNPGNNSNISGVNHGAPISPVSNFGESSNFQPTAESSSGQEGGVGSTGDTHVFKRPSTRNMIDYDSDSDTIQTWIITRARRVNKHNLYRLQSMYEAFAADNPDFPTDEHYESSSQIIRKFTDYRNKKTDGKISIKDLSLLINRKRWNNLSYNEICELSDDVDYELNENRKMIKWTKDDLLKVIAEKNKTYDLKEKEEITTEINKFIDAIKSYKVTELGLRKEQLALNFRKAGITPSDVSSISEESNES
jgi:hypothetical protein